MRSTLMAVLLAIAVVAVGAYTVWQLWEPAGPRTTGIADIGGPFTLVDQEGNARTDADFRGEHMLVFFGFTYCPDICPTVLNDVTLALDELGPLAERVRPILITVDPARDTPEALKDYVAHFHPRLVALTGSPEAIADAARAYRVYYARSGDGEDYLVDHSTILYLMGPDGRYIEHFSHSTRPEELAAALRRHLS